MGMTPRVVFFALSALSLAALMLHSACGVPADSTGPVILGPGDFEGDGDSQSDGGPDSDADPGDGSTNGDSADPDDGDGGGDDDGPPDGGGGSEFADACAAVNGRTFVFSGGLTISFGNALFTWLTPTDRITGIFSCDGFNLLGTSTANERFLGTYNPADDSLTWDNQLYLPEGG